MWARGWPARSPRRCSAAPGRDVTLIDPFDACRPDFRCEKLEEPHVDALRKAGVLDEVVPAALRYRDIWVARLGRLAEVKPIEEYGIEYSALVNRLRGLVPGGVAFVQRKVTDVALVRRAPDPDARLAASRFRPARDRRGRHDGRAWSASAARSAVAIRSRSASTSRRRDWPFDALTYFGEDPVHRVAYLTLFPLPSGPRANLFVYRALNDPWLKRLRDNPAAAIAESMPGLARFTGPLRVKGALKIRPVDLRRDR